MDSENNESDDFFEWRSSHEWQQWALGLRPGDLVGFFMKRSYKSGVLLKCNEGFGISTWEVLVPSLDPEGGGPPRIITQYQWSLMPAGEEWRKKVDGK